METISLKCTGCGAALDIAPELDVFSCGYCGARQIVRRAGGTVSLKPLEKVIERVQRGTDRTASELALRRLREELAAADDEIRKFRINFASESENAFGGSFLGVISIVIGGAIVIAVTHQWAPVIAGISFWGTIIGSIAYAVNQQVNQRSRDQERLAEAEKPLLAKRQKIEEEIQKHLTFLDSPSI